MTKSVTILIACYNGAQYLRRCLDSCVQQTYKNLEILIVNDGSTDESQVIIAEYMSKHQNIHLINQSNQGLSKTRNLLVENCTTTYGYFLDADDWIEPDCIAYFVAHSANYQLVIGQNFLSKKDKDKSFWINRKVNAKTTNESYLIANSCFCWNILFETKYLQQFKFFEGACFFEDTGLMSYLIYKTKAIKFLLEPKYHYWVNPHSASRGKMNLQKLEDFWNQLKYFYTLIEQENFVKYPRTINGQLAYYHALLYVYSNWQSNLNKMQKKAFKQRLVNLEKIHQKLKFPRRFWKFWHFFFYRICGC